MWYMFSSVYRGSLEAALVARGSSLNKFGNHCSRLFITTQDLMSHVVLSLANSLISVHFMTHGKIYTVVP